MAGRRLKQFPVGSLVICRHNTCAWIDETARHPVNVTRGEMLIVISTNGENRPTILWVLRVGWRRRYILRPTVKFMLCSNGTVHYVSPINRHNFRLVKG